MESNPSPEEAAAALDAAQVSAARLAGELRLPTHFHSSIGTAITVQIGTSAVGIAAQEGWAAALPVAGLGIFFAVAWVQLVRFRWLNGAWVWALASRVVFGSGAAASLTYCLAFAAAVVAAFGDLWWLVPVAALAGGIGYTWGGRRWLRLYREDPATRAQGPGIGVVALCGLVAAVALALLVAAH